MAYADKITTMRRMCVVVKGHNLVWEGVRIEDSVLLRSYADGFIMYKTMEEFYIWFEQENTKRECEGYEPLVVKYQDQFTKNWWEPRKEGYKK